MIALLIHKKKLHQVTEQQFLSAYGELAKAKKTGLGLRWKLTIPYLCTIKQPVDWTVSG